MRTIRFFAFFLVLFLAFQVWQACRSVGGEDALPATVTYNFHVRPILSDKCFKCHGPDQKQLKAGLRLDQPESAYAPLKETKGAFAIVPGMPEASEVMKRIRSTDSTYRMPTPDSHLGALTDQEIRIIEKWIAQGARYEKHWAFVAPVKSELPKASDPGWVKNEIDYFTLEKMADKGLQHNPEAAPEYLLKRIFLDLTGLLPTEADMDAFAADHSPEAYEKTIDRLLATPQYGEKMTLHWLDVSRYSDSYGYQDDNIRSQWPYRDWLIHAFNNNLPYDQFLTWQLAGDMLPQAGKEQILATAFLRNHKYTEEGGVIPEEYRVEYIVDKVKTYTRGLLALTAECAQCHDHKYDPISQKDYYQLFGFFNTSKEEGFEGSVTASKPAKKPALVLSRAEIDSIYTFIHKRDTGSVMVSVMHEQDTPRITRVLHRGAYDKPGDTVRASAFESILAFDTLVYPRNRLGLAQWTVSRQNPLTARVFVNQMWQEFFGTGLVKTTGDFGMQGNLPTHPALLDWLAVDFMEHNWDIKRLVKQILMSATYRQSAEITEQHLAVDPDNRFLARAPRIRLKAEFVRDLVLATSGLLTRDIGGPSVKPYQPAGLWESATSGRGELRMYEPDTGAALYRRGIYTFIKLTSPPPSMAIFDASNRDQCEVKRLNTNTPLQAFVMMNDPTVLEAARVLAQRLVAQQRPAEEAIAWAFRTIICRRPTTKEIDILKTYYAEQLQLFHDRKLNASKTLAVGESPVRKDLDPDQSAALMKVVEVVYNMEEAIVRG